MQKLTIDLPELATRGFHAVLLCDPSALRCYCLSGDRLVPMTHQVGLHEQALTFRASPDVLGEKCIPEMLRRLMHPKPRIALVVDGWDADVQGVVNDYVTKRNGRYATAHESVSFHLLGSSPSGILPLTEAIELFGGKHTGAVPLLHARAVEAGSVPAVTAVHPRDDQGDTCVVDFAMVKDVPAELDRIVWRCHRLPAEEDLETADLFRHIRAFDGGFTTDQLARALREPFLPRINDVVWTFSELRRFEGHYLSVPMVGFRRTYLKSESLLSSYTPNKFAEFGYEGYRLAQGLVITCSALKHLSAQTALANACRVCLQASAGGLRLLDLCEDVICELTGKVDFQLSLADVLIVWSTIGGDCGSSS